MGITVNSNMFTSQQMKGGITYEQGKQLKINLDTPEEPTQLFNFSSTPFMFMNEESTIIEGAPRKINPALQLLVHPIHVHERRIHHHRGSTPQDQPRCVHEIANHRIGTVH